MTKQRPKDQAQLKLSFTAIALGHREATTVVSLWIEEEDWTAVFDLVLRKNLFQKRSSASTHRIFREVKQRLQFLQPETLKAFVAAAPDDQKAILLIAACKCYPFIFQFLQGTLRDKLSVFDTTLQISDFDSHWNRLALEHPELDQFTEATRKKVRQVTFRILAEAGILSSTRSPEISPIPVSPTVETVLQAEGPEYREALLMP